MGSARRGGGDSPEPKARPGIPLDWVIVNEGESPEIDDRPGNGVGGLLCYEVDSGGVTLGCPCSRSKLLSYMRYRLDYNFPTKLRLRGSYRLG